MRLSKQTGLAFRSYGKAMDFIFKHGLWKYFIFTLIIALGLFTAVFYGIEWITAQLNVWLFGWVGNFLPDVSEWGWFGDVIAWFSDSAAWIVKLLMKVAFWFLFLSIYKFAMLMLLSPILALVSEKVEKILTGKEYPFAFNRFLKDILRGIGLSFRNMIIETGFLLLFFIVSFIPVIGTIVSLVAMFIISSYFYGFSMMDYTNERRRLSINDSIHFIRTHKGIAIGIGTIFSLCFIIPVIGTLVAPLVAPVWSVVAATIAIHEAIGHKFHPEKA